MQAPSTYSFAVEPQANNIRLVISKNGLEYVCRKERAGTLLIFLRSNEDSIFKGRLQLKKDHQNVLVLAKGEIVMYIDIADLIKLVTTISGLSPPKAKSNQTNNGKIR